MQLPDISNELKSVTDIISNTDFTEQITKGRNELENIQKKIQEKIRDNISEVKKNLDKAGM